MTYQHLCTFFYEVVWLVVCSFEFQADSDFYVVAELLKDYIGLIQAVKARNDVSMSAIILYFNNEIAILLYISLRF